MLEKVEVFLRIHMRNKSNIPFFSLVNDDETKEHITRRMRNCILLCLLIYLFLFALRICVEYRLCQCL